MHDADGWRTICESGELSNGGKGVRFDLVCRVDERRIEMTGFAVRFEGRVYAWLNQCRHVAMELDLLPGRFFDGDGRYLICSTHGALYEPDTGVCVSGPCRGASLHSIEATESDGLVRWRPDMRYTIGL